MKLPLRTAVFIALFPLLTGCISVSMTQTITREGTSSVAVLYDFSTLAGFQENLGAMAQEFGGEISGEDAADFLKEFDADAMCADITEDAPEWDNVRCEEKGRGRLLITGDLPLEEGMFSERQMSDGSIRYRYNVANFRDDALDTVNLQDASELGDMPAEQANLLLNMWSYTVRMPGVIIRTEAGKRVGTDAVTFSILDFSGRDSITVESMEGGRVTTGSSPVSGVMKSTERLCTRLANRYPQGDVPQRILERVQKRMGVKCR